MKAVQEKRGTRTLVTIYTIIKREYVTLMVFPQDKRLVFITAEPGFNIQEIPDVREILIEHMKIQ